MFFPTYTQKYLTTSTALCHGFVSLAYHHYAPVKINPHPPLLRDTGGDWLWHVSSTRKIPPTMWGQTFTEKSKNFPPSGNILIPNYPSEKHIQNGRHLGLETTNPHLKPHIALWKCQYVSIPQVVRTKQSAKRATNPHQHPLVPKKEG